MTKILLASLLVMTGALATNNAAFAQEAMHETVSNVEVVTTSHLEPGFAAFNTRAVRNFKKTYNNAEQPKWLRFKDGYTAIFTRDGIRYRVDYDKRGFWNGTQKDYTEDKLPRDIRARVKSVYYDYTIFWVNEVTLPEVLTGPVYFIHIEDAKSFKNISVYDDEMKVMNEFRKK